MFSALFGALEGIRIPDLPLRRRTLYPAELLEHITCYIVPKIPAGVKGGLPIFGLFSRKGMYGIMQPAYMLNFLN